MSKFNLKWQLVRLEAKSVKNVQEKISIVDKYLKEVQSKYAFERVYNWAVMTAVAYKGEDREQLKNYAQDIKMRGEYINEDFDISFNEVPTNLLKLLLKDLEKRKYGFQYNKTPRDHIDFVEKLTQYLEENK